MGHAPDSQEPAHKCALLLYPLSHRDGTQLLRLHFLICKVRVITSVDRERAQPMLPALLASARLALMSLGSSAYLIFILQT